MLCACGRYIYSTSANPWSSYVMDEWGRIVEATCVHGMHFSLQQMVNRSELEEVLKSENKVTK